MTCWGIFCFKSMLFRISSASEFTQREMDNILHGLDEVICMTDDVLCLALHQQKTGVDFEKI